MYAFHKKRKNNSLLNNCQKKALNDLPQGKLEISCFLLFEGDAREINKQMKLFTDQSDPTPTTRKHDERNANIEGKTGKEFGIVRIVLA